jgi:Mn2+/Fe2+ NRAMP family transporter
MSALKEKFAQFGPGLLYAGAAVGVSHLVQSTRAGAEFGFQLLWVVLLVNIIKYPIFESGPRYAAATGKSLLEGYKRIGDWAVLIYMILSISTMFIIMAAISIVTSGLFIQITGIHVDTRVGSVALLFVSVLLLGLGKYATLDRFMKVIIVLLTVSTLIAVSLSFIEPSVQYSEFFVDFELTETAHLLFLVALIGWMPAPVDISIWHSVWSASKMKEQGRRIPLKTALQDFNLGYWGTTVLAVCFLSLGALVLFGTGEELSTNSVEFSAQLVGMYTSNLGQWAFPFIALAAFTTMFSTLLTCLDAFPRTLRKATKLLLPSLRIKKRHQPLYWFWIVLTAIGTSIFLLYFLSNMRAMVDLATTISFVVAPILAVLNYVAVNDSSVPKAARQSSFLRYFNLFSILILAAFSSWFVLSKF